MHSFYSTQFGALLIETGHSVEAEKLLIDTLVDGARKKHSTNNFETFDFSNHENLIALAQIYYAAGRWQDILTLLTEVHGWGAPDLVDIAEKRLSEYRYSTPSLGLMAARAYAETGQLPRARVILDEVLRVDGADDAAYELLLKIGQGDLVARMDRLYQQDQFENRPLIWKASLLLHQGKLDEAERTARTAIAVDPSDGQSGKGDRMRVYSVMAEIEMARKDDQQAKFFGNIVKAIRLSENADDYFDAGLLTRAVKMYADALSLFSDAYCIQSRIARQLAELGRMDEAAVHYRKAFELMPVSFGRMESHCFGCERAFQGKTAEGIAQQTFTEMIQKDPGKPQLHYLLGYLRMEEGHYAAALPEYLKAAQLDPDYINAWKQINEIGDHFQLSPDVRDEAIFNLIRLDPEGRHDSPDTRRVRQLSKLWTVLEDANKTMVPPPASLLPLKSDPAPRGIVMEDRFEKKGKPRLPAKTIAENEIISWIVENWR